MGGMQWASIVRWNNESAVFEMWLCVGHSLCVSIFQRRFFSSFEFVRTYFVLINRDCPCRTCILAGGPCFTQLKENSTQFYCTKCTVFEKLDREYLDCVTEFINTKSDEANKKVRLVYQAKDTNKPITFSIDNMIDPSEEWTNNHGYHMAWAVFKHLPSNIKTFLLFDSFTKCDNLILTARRPYNTLNFSVEHFCSYQTPVCNRNECRVATQIIAGLYPLNFSKFLVSAYQPLTEDERKELMNIQHLYFTYLIRKLCNDNTKTVSQASVNDMIYDVDDTDYALLCDIGSAFAECYLTETKIPLEEALDSCFSFDGLDIELNMFWLDCIYMTKTTEKMHCSPKKRNGFEEDPKLMELKELRSHMDKLFLERPSAQKTAVIKQEELVPPPIASIQPTERVLPPSSSSSSSTSSASVSNVAPVVQSSGTIKKEQKVIDQSAKAACEDIKAKCDSSSPKGDHLAEAIKLAVNQELNLWVFCKR